MSGVRLRSDRDTEQSVTPRHGPVYSQMQIPIPMTSYISLRICFFNRNKNRKAPMVSNDSRGSDVYGQA